MFNVVAMVKGSEKPDEYVVLSSHFDSWDGGIGATDNGTGTLTMLEAMRILHKVYPHPSGPSSPATGAARRRAKSGRRRSPKITPR